MSSQGEAEGSEKSENVLNENYCMHNESVSNENVQMQVECEFSIIKVSLCVVQPLIGAKFKPLYISYTYSRYDEEKVVWKGNVTQEVALEELFKHTDDEMMDSFQAAIIDNPDNEEVVLPVNPCHHGLIFSGFQVGKLMY